MDTCNVVGCFKPRYKSTGGYEYSYCYDHWVEMEARKRDAEAAEPVTLSAAKPCAVEGCGQARHIAKSGHTYTYCSKTM